MFLDATSTQLRAWPALCPSPAQPLRPPGTCFVTLICYFLSDARRLSTILQILLFLPLTLATLSTPAFLLLSLLLFIHSLVHGTLVFFWGSASLSFLQVPMHPFLLLVCFNVFSQSVPTVLTTAAAWWGTALAWSSLGFIFVEGLSTLLVVQKLGQLGRQVADEGEGYQFGLLVGAAVAFVSSAWWIASVSGSSVALSQAQRLMSRH